MTFPTIVPFAIGKLILKFGFELSLTKKSPERVNSAAIIEGVGIGVGDGVSAGGGSVTSPVPSLGRGRAFLSALLERVLKPLPDWQPDINVAKVKISVKNDSHWLNTIRRGHILSCLDPIGV